MNEITITVSGDVGSGKSAILGEIEIMLKALGVPVRYADEEAAQCEKGMTHADWTSALEMYKPSVVLVEDMPWLRKPSVGVSQPVAPDLLQAVENFIAVKGRHHTEQAYQRLVSVFEQVKGE